MLILDKIDFKTKAVPRDKEGGSYTIAKYRSYLSAWGETTK